MFTLPALVAEVCRRLISTMPKPAVIFVLGGPGAGKGTQCSKIVEEFGYVHLSAGDLLREERKRGSKDGDLIENYIREGKIVPVEITARLLEQAMISSGKDHFLIDGFPRNEDNLAGWNKFMADKVTLTCVLFFDCSEEVCVKRIRQRGLSSGRSDDNEESIRKRFHTYRNETMPIIEHYERQGLVRRIRAVPPPDEVFEEVRRALQSL